MSGNSGLGKSTLVNTLFKSQVSRRSAGWARDEKIPKTVEVKAVSHGEFIYKCPRWHYFLTATHFKHISFDRNQLSLIVFLNNAKIHCKIIIM